MKRDLCFIVGIINSDPRKYASPIESHAAANDYTHYEASMDIFCKAMVIVQGMEITPDSPLKGYAVLFAHENYQGAFDLIFSNTSSLRFDGNHEAHSLAPLKEDIDKILDRICYDDERPVAKMCFVAFDTFRPINLRVEDQKEAHEMDEQSFFENFGWMQHSNWKQLNDWLRTVKDKGVAKK